jgi:hypothetical protein
VTKLDWGACPIELVQLHLIGKWLDALNIDNRTEWYFCFHFVGFFWTDDTSGVGRPAASDQTANVDGRIRPTHDQGVDGQVF